MGIIVLALFDHSIFFRSAVDESFVCLSPSAKFMIGSHYTRYCHWTHHRVSWDIASYSTLSSSLVNVFSSSFPCVVSCLMSCISVCGSHPCTHPSLSAPILRFIKRKAEVFFSRFHNNLTYTHTARAYIHFMVQARALTRPPHNHIGTFAQTHIHKHATHVQSGKSSATKANANSWHDSSSRQGIEA